jgi:hypothetical protein
MKNHQGKRHQKRRSRFVAKVLFLTVLTYIGLAYALIPDVWFQKDKSHLQIADVMVTTTPDGIWGDPVNIGIVGAQEDLLRAFAAADWNPADAITLRTSVAIGLSVLLDHSYEDAPVSTLLFDGRPQDLAFQKPDGKSPDRRHHIRLWKVAQRGPVQWLGAASFDASVGLSHDTGQITHHIDPDIDSERELIISDLRATGCVDAVWQIPGVGATQTGRNGGGDRYYTDGMASVAQLSAWPCSSALPSTNSDSSAVPVNEMP